MHEMGLRHDKPYRKSARIVGECFVKGTLVSTPKGLIPIEKLKVGDEVYTQNGVRRVVELYIMPKQELVEVILENGLKNVCTKGQMFKVITSDLRFVWKKAEELKRGDRIVLRAVYPDIKEYKKLAGLTLDEDLAYLLGFFLADGWIDKAGGIRFFSEERRIIERLANIITDKFKVGVKIESRNGGHVLRAKGSKVEELMGIQDKILEQILKSPKSVVYAFIAGFIDGRGEILRSRSAILIRSTSEVLIRMLQVVLFSLGIVSSLHENGSCHYLEIEGAFFAKLIENLRGLSCKADIHAVLPYNRYTKGFRYLNAIGVKSRYFSRAKICRRNPADSTRVKELGICENDDIFFMEVKEVRKAEPDVTYDIQVEEEHEFIANGMIAHNCLGKYHPHGDQPVYEALVRMAQDFVMRYPLVDGQGNFGSIDGDEPAAMRYCVTADSLVITEKGLIKIGEIVDAKPNSDNPIDLNVLSANGRINKSDMLFHSGKHRVLKIKTKFGYEIEGTLNHPIVVIEKDEEGRPKLKWKMLSQVKVGDYVAINRIVPMDWQDYEFKLNGKVIKIDKDWAIILGALVSEGHLEINSDRRSYRVLFVNTSERFVDIFLNSLKSIASKLGFESNIKVYTRVLKSGKEMYEVYVLNKEFCELLEHMGLNSKSSEREIPKPILMSSKEIQKWFLRALFEGDGSVNVRKDGISIYYYSSSLKLLKQIQILLLNFGIVSSIKKDKNLYRLIIYTQDAKRFADEIGFLCDKNDKLKSSLDKFKFNALNYDRIPYLSSYLRSKYSGKWIKKNNLSNYSRLEKNFEKLKEILSEEDLKLVEFFLKTRYFFDKVVEIKENGVKDVYSIRVNSDCHSFVANGFVNHNTEARLTKLAEELLADIDKDTVDFVPNFDATLKEPSVLPARIPNLLVNGSSGIAVGMATNIPPHNLKEVCRAIIAYIKNPEISVKELMEFVKGPDFPTGGIIVGKKGIEKAYETGKGKIVVRGRVEIEKNAIVIREVPYMVNKARLVEKIADLIKDGRLEEAKTVRDESDREGIRVVVELKGGADVDTALKKLYTYTPLQTTFGIINLALVDGEPRILNLKELIACYVDHRREVVRRRTAYELRKARDRLHIVEGLKKAVENLESVVNLIKKARTPEEAKKGLMESYGLSEKQAEAILQMRLQKLTSTEISALLKEYDELKEKIAELEAILSNPSRIDEIIIEELEELIDEYGDERRTEILEEEEEIKAEELITSEENLVVITENGFVKRMDIEFKTQARGGVGVLGMPVRDGDAPAVAVLCNSLQKLLVFTNVGKAYWISVHEIPKQDRTGKGVSIRKFLGLAKGEKVVSAVAVDDFVGDQYVVILTEDGYIKKTKLSEFANAKRAGIIASSAKIAFARMFKDGEVAIATNNGYLARFKAEEVPEKGRNAKGVKAISLREGDSIAWLSIGKEKEFLILTEDGLGKRTDVEEFRLTNRGSMGVIAIRGKIAVVDFVKGKEDVVIFTKDGYAIRVAVKNIPKQERYSKGVEVSKRGVSCAILI